MVVAVASCFAGYAQANPTNPTVISGAATFAASGKTLNIANTPGAIINWQGFSVKADELTRFIQQNAQSAVLNRVTSQEQSAILGQLLSNGRVYLINPNGITIGAGARIDTAGFVASSLNLSDGDALAGKFKLQDGGNSGKVINNGAITTPSGGFVYLIAPDVENNGIITSPKGEIILAAGKSVELVDSQKPELRVELTAPENTAINVGRMIAEAGSIGIFAGAIKQDGVISANSAVVGENGKIYLKASKDVSLAAGSSTTANGPSGGSITIQSDSGSATIAGTVEANGTQGKGGSISVTAPVAVTVAPSARVSANGSEGGSVTLASSAGAVTVSAPVSANATDGAAGQIAVNAATTAALTAGQLSASGGLGGGTVSVRGVSGVTLDATSSTQANGAAGGTVSIASDQGAITAQGTIDVSASDGVGGNVKLTALSDITLDVANNILASGASGGEVYIESGEGTLLSSGLIDGRGSDGQGGRVLLLAPRVGLIREAVVNVSGRTGGGTALVGGDYQGKNPDIQNAQRTYVGPDARIVADAVDSGNGGKVIVWADEITRYYGHISVRGGAQGGDGGGVEVSGKESLVFRGTADGTAQTGFKGGTILLDPRDIIINNAGADTVTDQTAGTVDLAFSSPDVNTDVTLNPQTGGAFNGFAEINLQADRDILVQSAFNVKTAIGAGTNASLVLAAGRHINVGADVTSGLVGANEGNILLLAGDSITLGANVITDNAGTITIRAAATDGDLGFNSTNFDVNTAGSIIWTAGSIQAGSGLVTLIAGASGGIGTSGANIRTTASTINATSGSGGVFITESDAVSLGTISSGGAVQVSNTTGNMTVGTVTATGAVTLSSTAGSILDDANNGTTIAGGSVSLNAASGAIGAAGATNEIDTNTASLILDAGTDIYVANTTTPLTALTVTVRPTGTATYSVSDPGLTFTVADAGPGNALNLINISDSGLNLSLTNAVATGGDINVGAVAVGTGDVTLVSTAGSLVNASSTVTGGAVTLTANSGGVGASGQAINTTATTLTATSGTGGIYIDEAEGATVSTVTVTGATGDIKIQNAAGTLSTTGVISTQGGSITLTSVDDLSVGNAVTVSALNGTVSLTSDSNGDNTGSFAQTAGTISTNNGAISITNGDADSGTGNVLLGLITDTGGKGITVKNQEGSILENTAGSSLLISAGTISLLAGNTTKGATSLGDSTEAINTQSSGTGTINATSGTGGIYIDEADAAIIGTVTTTGAGNIKIQNLADGTLSTTGVVSSTGAGTIDLLSFGALSLGADVTSAGGAITLAADTDSNEATGVEKFEQTAGAIGSGGGTVGITVATAVGTGTGGAELRAINSGAGTLTVTSHRGSIIEDATGTSLLTSSGTISLKAGETTRGTTRVGTLTEAINTQSSGTGTINATSGTGGIYIDEADAAIIGTVTTTGAGNIKIQNLADGTLSTTGVVSSTGAGTIDLLSFGALSLGADVTSAGGAATLTAGTTIDSNASSTINTTGSAGNPGAGGGEVLLHSTGAGDITLNALITASGGHSTGISGGGAGGVVTILNDNGAINVHNITTRGGAAGGGGAAGTDGAIQLSATTTIGQQASTSLQAGNLKLRTTGGTGGAVTLINTGNDVGTLAANLTAGSSLSYVDANSATIGTANAAGTGAANLGSVVGITAAGNVTLTALGAGDLMVSNDIVKTGGGNQTVTLKASQNIIFNSSADVNGAGIGGTYTIVLNSDLDANSAGAIQLNDGTVLSSNDGSITLGGGLAGTGASNAAGFAGFVEGVKLDGAQLVSGAGAIVIRGTGVGGTTNAHGVSLTTASSTVSSITSTSGPINVSGTGGAGTDGDRGIYLTAGSSIASGSGLITLTGTGTGTGTSNHGVELDASSIISTGTTAIQMTGTGAAGSNDILASGASTIGSATASGDILLNGATAGGTALGAGTVTLQTSGNVTLNQTGGGVNQTGGSILANGLRLLGVGAFNLNQAANNVNVLVADLTGAATSLSYRDTNGFSIGTAGPGGLSTVKTAGGGATSTSGITVGSAVTAANTLTLNAYGAVTQATAADNVTAGGLQLLGNGPYTLANAGNDVTTFAANVAGNVSYRDANGFTVGVVADAPTSVGTTGITTTADGAVILDNAGVLTIAQNVSTDGAFAQVSTAGAGSVSISSPRSISTTSDAVSLASPVTLNGAGTNTTIDTRVGGGAGGDITFQSTLDAATAAPNAETLTLDAGTGGNILFSGAVGVGGRLGTINVTNANNVTESAGITAASLVQAAGQGTTTFDGTVNTNTAMGVNLTGNAQTVNAGITTTGNGIVTFSNAGVLTLNGDIAADGAVTQNGAGAVTITAPGSITTTSDAINFLRAVTLNGGASGLVSMDTRVGGGAGGDITFQSTLDAATAAPNAETLTLDAGTGGNILFSGAVGVGGRLGAINVTNANNVTESAGITAASLVQAAGQGTTTFDDAVNTNTATGVNLTGNAQTVNAGITTTGAGVVTLSNAGVLTLNGDIAADGAVTQNGAGAVTIDTGRAITTTADAVGFARDVTLAKTGGTGLLTINTTSGNAAGANITFSSRLTGTSDSAENLTITAGSGGAVTFGGAVGATRLGDAVVTQARDVTIQSGFDARTLTQLQGAAGAPTTTPSAGTTTINGAVNTTGNTGLATSGALHVSGTGSIAAGAGSVVTLTTGGDMTLSGSVTAPAGATLNVVGTDRILTQNGGTLATSDSAIALIADEMILTGAIDSGSGAVTLKPNNPTDAIELGAAAASTKNSAATLELSDSELNTITTTGGLTIGASNNTGAITVAGAITPTTAQNGLTLLNRIGGIAINAPFTYAAGNGNLTLTANGGGAAAGALTASGGALEVSGILAMNAASGVGTLTSPMVLSRAAGTTLTVANTTSGGVFERADSGDLNVDAIDNLAPTGAGINLNVGTSLNINGKVENVAGDIQFVTGNDTAYTGAGGFGLSPAAVAAGTLGGVNINGRVVANNGGGISIFSTGAVKQSTAVAAGLQSIPATGTDARGALNVRTFNSGTQVGVIDLQNNLAGSGNSMGPITLEARLAGSLNPPPYAESNLAYRSINGTNISGVGTAADFSFVAPSQTIDLAPGASLSGTNISLIATAGDVTVKSAITNAQINGGQSGGSLNLYATGNIVLNNPGGDSAGVVIGKDLGTLDKQGDREFEKFDHTLKLVAMGDIKIYGTVQVTGDLALRANAGASEASGPGGVAGFGAGSGSVIIAGSAGNSVEVRAKNIVVGVKDASGNPLPVRDLIIDNSANAANSGQFFDSILRADSKLDIYLNGDQGGAGTSGNIVITGGSANATSAGIVGTATKSSALAVIRGDVVSILGVKGGTQGEPNLNPQTWKMQDPDTPDPTTQTVNPLLPYTTNSSSITLNGGVATSNTAAGGGALAAADALILGTSSKFMDIGGNIVLIGGTADSKGGGQTSAAAKIDPVNLRINTGGYIKLVGGEGGGARAALVNSGDMEINIGGKLDYTYTDAGGTHTVQGVGLILIGGKGSGLYDRDNQPIELYYDVSSQVLLLFPAVNGGAGGGTYVLQEDLAKASAFVQSLSPRGFDDSLMAYVIFAANEETRTGHINTAVSKDDDANKPSCN